MTESRLEKAQRLVDGNAVTPLLTTPCFTAAMVQGDHASYICTLFTFGTYSCDCEWGQGYSYTDNLCSHALAVQMAIEKEDAK